jgi:hypothetical protein
MNFCWGKSLYIEWGSRKERNGVVWQLAEVWQLRGIRRNINKGRCPLYVVAEDIIHILRDCLEIFKWYVVRYE